MKIIPAMYLLGGTCVSQYKDDASQTGVISRNPLQVARLFEKQGATQLHIVHLDERRDDILKTVVHGTALKVTSAGYVTTMQELETVFALGVDSVALDADGEKILEEALAKFGSGKIFFTITSQRGEVEAMNGLEVVEYARELANRGVTEIIFRDLRAQGTLHPNFDEVERLVSSLSTAGAANVHIYSFGGVGSEKAIKILEETGAAGVIISRAFFEGHLSLAACLKKFHPGR